MNAAMEASKQNSTSERRKGRGMAVTLIVAVALIAAGLYAWSSLLRSVRYEIEIEPAQLFSGSSDTVCIRAVGINRWNGEVPFSHPSISATIIEGAEFGTIIDGEDPETVRFISNGGMDGQVMFRVIVDGWPFPMMAVVSIATPVAVQSFHQLRNGA